MRMVKTALIRENYRNQQRIISRLPVAVCFMLFLFKNVYIIAKEVEVLRTKITLACTDCKQRNYNTMKDKKVHPDRMETKKYCRFCNKHTLHRETK